MAIIFSTTFDDTNFPTRRAVGRHWDQTIDGRSESAIGTPTDGISGSGDWTTIAGAGDQVLTAANNPSGGGGKGYRHWVGPGHNNGGGGLSVEWPVRSELWFRWYFRFPVGFSWSGGQSMKMIYTLSTNFPGTFYFGFHDGFIGGHVENDNISRVVPGSGSFLMGTGNFYSDNFWGHQELWGGSTGDGQWHAYEIHVKGNTNGQQNGILEWRIDGILRGSWNNVRFAASGNASWDWTRFGENHTFINGSVDQPLDFDDFAISDSGWVGLLSGDTTAPILSSPNAGTPTSDGTVGASVSTDEANGTLYWAVVTNGGSATAAQIKAGSGGNIVAGKAGSQTVTSTGTQTIPTITGLSASTTYQIKFLHSDAANNDSSQASVDLTTTGGADTTPPTLSNPSSGTATSSGSTGANVTTNEANGTLYWAVVTNGGSCTDAQLKAGSGGNIVSGVSANQPVTALGVQVINITGLNPSTTYQIKFLHRDAAGNDSTQASVNLVTTAVSSRVVFFQEGFEDSNLSTRGWFDGTEGTIDNAVYSPNGGAGSIKFHWQLGNTNGDPQTGSRRHTISQTGTETLQVEFDIKLGTSGTPWQGSGQAGYHPHIFYILSNNDNEFGALASNYLNFYIEAGDVSSGNTKPRIVIQDNLRINSGQLNVDLLGTSTAHSVAGYNGEQTQATPSFVDKFGGNNNYTYWTHSSRTLLNDTWHTYKVYMAMNSIVGGLPQANGVMRVWVNDVLQFERTNVYYRNTQYDQQRFKTLVLAPYIGDGSPIAQDMWLDNLVVADRGIDEFIVARAVSPNQQVL